MKSNTPCPPRRLVGGIRDRVREVVRDGHPGCSFWKLPGHEGTVGRLSAGLGTGPRLSGYAGYTAVLNLIKKDGPLVEDAAVLALVGASYMADRHRLLLPCVAHVEGVGTLTVSEPAPLVFAATPQTRQM